MREFRHPILFWVCLLWLGLSFESAAAGLDAVLDRTRVAEGDSVVLLLSAPGDSTDSPDLAPLEQDFDVLSQSQSSRIEIVNGRSSSTREWQISLSPKRSGKLQVPSLRLGASASAPLNLEVLPAAQAAKLGSSQPIKLEVEATPDKPYVQGKVIYTVRILVRGPLSSASLTDPKAGDAIIERQGDDKQSEAYRDGQRYLVIERRYSIFPQHSGALQIEPPVLTAQVRDQTNARNGSLRQRMFGGRDPFDGFDSIFDGDPFSGMGGMLQRTRPVQLRGERVTLDVQPQPAGTSSPWIPAESLVLSEDWTPQPLTFRVGEPVTRTVAITAQGITGAQLPELKLDAPGIKIYPDKPQVETRAEGDTLVAQKIVKAALVPTQTGEFTIPKVQVKWWNTEQHREETASLPARKVLVLPAAAGSTPVPQSQQPQIQAQSQPPATVGSSASEITPPVGAAIAGESDSSPLQALAGLTGSQGYWPWVSALLALAWLLSTWLWWRARSRPVPVVGQAASVTSRQNPTKQLRAVESACRANDPRAARLALLDWAEGRWPKHPPKRLEELARLLPSEVQGPLRELDRSLYAGSDSSWNGAETWSLLKLALNSGGSEKDSEYRSVPLPPLYSS